jgi:hypothetical protein
MQLTRTGAVEPESNGADGTVPLSVGQSVGPSAQRVTLESSTLRKPAHSIDERIEGIDYELVLLAASALGQALPVVKRLDLDLGAHYVRHLFALVFWEGLTLWRVFVSFMISWYVQGRRGGCGGRQAQGEPRHSAAMSCTACLCLLGCRTGPRTAQHVRAMRGKAAPGNWMQHALGLRSACSCLLPRQRQLPMCPSSTAAIARYLMIAHIPEEGLDDSHSLVLQLEERCKQPCIKLWKEAQVCD